MKTYLVKIKCNGRFPCHAFKTVKAESVDQAIVMVNNEHLEKGCRDRRDVVAVYEQLWNIDPQKM